MKQYSVEKLKKVSAVPRNDCVSVKLLVSMKYYSKMFQLACYRIKH